MPKTFELPLDALKSPYIFYMFHETQWSSEVDFNFKNPGFTFKIEIIKKDEFKSNQVYSLKKSLNKALKNIDKTNEYKIKKESIKNPVNKKKLNKDLISNLKSMNYKFENLNLVNIEDDYDDIHELESISGGNESSDFNEYTDDNEDSEDNELDEILNSLN